MTAKEYLSQAYCIEKRINLLIEQAEGLKQFTENCTAKITGMPKAKNKSTSPIADAVCKMVDREKDIADEIERLSLIRNNICKVIDTIEDADCCAVLTKRYLRYKTWEQISKEMNYSKRWVHNAHSRALDMIQKLMPEGVDAV